MIKKIIDFIAADADDERATISTGFLFVSHKIYIKSLYLIIVRCCFCVFFFDSIRITTYDYDLGNNINASNKNITKSVPY